jgi:peptidase M28-like protein/PDZ domain-containing protein
MFTYQTHGARTLSLVRGVLAVRSLFAVLSIAAAQACASVGSAVSSGPGHATRSADANAIRSDISYLASDQLEGRRTGTPGNDSAAAYIARRFAALGLRPLEEGYLQHFVARPLPMHGLAAESLPTENVIAMLPGRDSSLRGEYVVIGAHFDHLGRSTEGALDPDQKNAIRRGADDNASGTAAVLELARLFAASPTRRSLVFVTFTGEELGLLGSEYYVEHSPLPLDSAVAMVNFDMVGRLRDDKLIIYGVATARELAAILDSANAIPAQDSGADFTNSPWRAPLRLTVLGDGFGPSDHSSFYARNVPVLHFFTDLHDDYHRASDVASKINTSGEAHVVDLAERVVRTIADRPDRLTFIRTASPTPAIARQGSDVYLGSIPDMSAGASPGLRLTGVRAGSPAEQAGLAAGDVVIDFGGRAVTNLYDYSDALYSHRPGDVVAVTILRNGERKRFTVKLGRR